MRDSWHWHGAMVPNSGEPTGAFGLTQPRPWQSLHWSSESSGFSALGGRGPSPFVLGTVIFLRTSDRSPMLCVLPCAVWGDHAFEPHYVVAEVEVYGSCESVSVFGDD